MFWNRKPRHEHKWKVFQVGFTQPVDIKVEVTCYDSKSVEMFHKSINDARTGQTHFYMKCIECGDIDCKTVPGIVPRKGEGTIVKTT